MEVRMKTEANVKSRCYKYLRLKADGNMED